MTIGIKYDSDLATLLTKRDEIKKIVQGTFGDIPPAERNYTTNELTKINTRIIELEKKRTEELAKQVALTKAQRIEKGLIASEDEIASSSKLTKTEEEQLDIARQLIENKLLYAGDTEKQLQLQIELVRNEENFADIHKHTIEIEQLQNKLVEERIQLRLKEKNEVQNLLVEYAKSTGGKRTELSRTMELVTMRPQELLNTFQNKQNIRDRDIILNNMTLFSPEMQDKFAKELAIEFGKQNIFGFSWSKTSKISDLNKGIGPVGTAPVTPVPITQTNVGAENVNVYINGAGLTPEQLAALTAKMVKSSLLTDEDFQKLFAPKLSNKI
jgi:hypothetical protein